MRVPLDGSRVERRALHAGVELPHVAPSAHMPPYQYAYGQATRGRDGTDW